MGSLQIRLFLTYFVIIGVTLGLTALSLFLLLGGYRDSITYGNLDDLGSVINATANAEFRNALVRRQEGDAAVPAKTDLVLSLRRTLSGSEAGEVTGKVSVAVVDRNGKVVPGIWASVSPLENGQIRDVPAPTATPGSSEPTPTKRCRMDVPGGAQLLCVSIPLSQSVLGAFEGTDAAALVVAEPAAGLGEVLGDLMPRLVFSGLIGVAAALVLGYVLAQSVAAPLGNIARAARNVARGNYRQRVPVTGPREVRDLAANFNRMTEEVQRSQQTLRDFLANISHELKTPLTSIRGFSQAMLDGTIDDTRGIEQSARIISAESSRVLRLVAELLDLSRIESGQASMRQDEFDLGELFGHIDELFQLRAEESGILFTVDLESRGAIRGDFDRLEQVLNNLLDNAFRYTPPEGMVRLAARDMRPGVIQVTVSDTGSGIPQEDIPHLFDRFYRGGNGARPRENGKGYGLGLAITREIVRAHGGEIWATSERGRGTTFVFTLPTAGRTAQRAAAR